MNEKTENGVIKGKNKGNTLKIITMVFLAAQLLMIIGMSLYMFISNLFPMDYIALFGGVLLFVWVLQFLFLYRSNFYATAKRLFCIILSIICIAAIFAAFRYVYMFVGTIGNISTSTEIKEEANTYTVRVLKDNPVQDINGLKDKQLGVSELYNEEDVYYCKNDIDNAMDSELNYKDYEDVNSLIKGLAEKDSDAILFDESAVAMVEEQDPDFMDNTRVIYEIKVPASQNKVSKQNRINTKKETFNVLITGIDTRTDFITSKGNSDVNILVTINPKDKKILLTNTPRDYFVPLEGNEEKMDKLTHAGNYGAKCSMDTISALYDTPIDRYVKVNFVSVERLVDAFGGVTVESEESFTAGTRSGRKVQFRKGENKLDGAAALAYARERKSFAAGDRVRGKHQQQIIEALINKLTAGSMLSNYSEVLDIVQSNTITNMSTEEMTELIKMQLSRGGKWDIESISVDGTGDRQGTYSYRSHDVYVMIPDQSTVETAKAKIKSYF